MSDMWLKCLGSSAKARARGAKAFVISERASRYFVSFTSCCFWFGEDKIRVSLIEADVGKARLALSTFCLLDLCPCGLDKKQHFLVKDLIRYLNPGVDLAIRQRKQGLPMPLGKNLM